MSYDKRVRVRDASGAVTTARVVRIEVDPARGTPKRSRGASTLVVIFEGGKELAVDSIESVALPIEGTEAAFEGMEADR